MKNKGFTLIEILAVIVILMILITLITPKVFKQLKTAENITDQEQINTIINISKIYMNQNTDLLPIENNIYTISIDELKQSGLIQTKQILNPSTKEELTGYIIVKNENNKYKYEYKEENELITVTFDSQGGTIQQTSKKLLTGEKYGTLPTPTREGYTFMGWAKQTYDTYDFIRYYDASNTLRISPDVHYQSSEKQIIEDEDILIFDVSFSDSTIKSIEIDDKVLDSSKYLSENGRVYGKINIETSMLKSGIMFYNFVDINYNSKPTNYTINKFLLIKHDDIVSPQTIVSQETNHTLYAIWKANE